MAEQPSRLLRTWLQRQLPETAFDWLAGQLEALQQDPSDRKLHIALGMIPRRLGKDDLALSEADLEAAEAARPGWDPRGWSVDEAARILALLAAAGANTGFAERFTALCGSAEVGEAIALYRGLPLYPDPAALEDQAAEGLRTNMRAVFEAVAHRNPFPRERFDENRWNQMVLKALFIGSSLHPIQGLDARANPALAAILIDYAHERWAAGRPVSPELWRCVGPFAVASLLPDLERALRGEDETERRAAALALAASPAAEARVLLAGAGALAAEIESGALTWERLEHDPVAQA
ncbi:MAG: EboA domain-containing protein [Kiloniellales bacterium]|nr:EboA domain-containing protein [Kiloniellales bacterium]